MPRVTGMVNMSTRAQCHAFPLPPALPHFGEFDIS